MPDAVLSAGASHAAPTCAPVARGRALIAPARAPRPGGVQDLRALRPAWHQRALPVPDSASASPSATRRRSPKVLFFLSKVYGYKKQASPVTGLKDAETPMKLPRGGAARLSRAGGRVAEAQAARRRVRGRASWSGARPGRGTLGDTAGGSHDGITHRGRRRGAKESLAARSTGGVGASAPQFARGNGGLPSA